MHDDPRLFPHLPARRLEPDEGMSMLEPVRGTVWQTCWEYVLTHELTDTEGSAFWHGASLIHAAMETQLNEARGDSPSGFWSQREWEDWSNELTFPIPDDLACGNPEGAQESIIEDTLAHLVRCVRVADTEEPQS